MSCHQSNQASSNAQIIDYPGQNCLDIGTKRFQWGISSVGDGGSVSMPFPFKDTSYVVSYSPNDTNTNVYALSVSGKTVSSFNVKKPFLGGGGGALGVWNESFNWKATGLKP